MHDTELYHQLELFLKDADARLLSGFNSREWLQGDYTRVYVRRTRHWLNNEWQQTLDIANITVDEEFMGRGIFKNLIAWLEARKYAIYVENVLNEQLRGFLLRNGFDALNLESTSPSYFKCC
jgi:hypothetical protein